VLSHARALLTSDPEGACDYIDADQREPDKILSGAAATLDVTQPVTLLLLGVLHHIPTLTRRRRSSRPSAWQVVISPMRLAGR
jgi:hypothetical protein